MKALPLQSKKPQASHARQVQQVLREAAITFLMADSSNDGELNFREFVDLLPQEMRGHTPESVLREAFDMADTDRSGMVSRTEFFFWTLNVAKSFSGMSAEVSISARHSADSKSPMNPTFCARALNDTFVRALSRCWTGRQASAQL